MLPRFHIGCSLFWEMETPVWYPPAPRRAKCNQRQYISTWVPNGLNAIFRYPAGSSEIRSLSSCKVTKSPVRMEAVTFNVFLNLLIAKWLLGENPTTLSNFNTVAKAKWKLKSWNPRRTSKWCLPAVTQSSVEFPSLPASTVHCRLNPHHLHSVS